MGNVCGDSAGPALRGFRLQILYTLARLTEPQTALQATLCPEGIEDLAISDDQGVLREAIQVKGHTAPLTLSELLDRPAKPAPFLSFDDAWRHFVGSAGNAGPLMEFVYLVTRTETLRERLKQQVDAIRDAAIEGTASGAGLRVLALVSFASALGARLNVAALRDNIAGVDLGRIVERLEREYLVRRLDQDLLLDGLHPVRSRLLADILCDGMTFDPQELAQRCLGLIAATDTEVFLLHLATRYAYLMPTMVQHLDRWQPQTWTAIGGVLRALLWWGARQYVDQISGLISEIQHTHGKAWVVILNLDLADLLPPNGTAVWKQFDFMGQEKKAVFQSLLDLQPPKAVALEPARHWLAALPNQPAAPTTEGDFARTSRPSPTCSAVSITSLLRRDPISFCIVRTGRLGSTCRVA